MDKRGECEKRRNGNGRLEEIEDKIRKEKGSIERIKEKRGEKTQENKFRIRKQRRQKDEKGKEIMHVKETMNFITRLNARCKVSFTLNLQPYCCNANEDETGEPDYDCESRDYHIVLIWNKLPLLLLLLYFGVDGEWGENPFAIIIVIILNTRLMKCASIPDVRGEEA